MGTRQARAPLGKKHLGSFFNLKNYFKVTHSFILNTMKHFEHEKC